MNNELQQIEMLLFQGKTAEGNALAADFLKKLDFDDDDDMGVLLRLLDRAVFQTGSAELIPFLKAAGFDFGFKWPGEGEILPLAVGKHCTEWGVLAALIEAGADPYAVDRQGRGVLHLALARQKPMWGEGPEGLVGHLLDHLDPAQLCDCDYYGGTPLHYAVLYGHSESVKLMLAKGIDPNRAGTTPTNTFSFALPLDGLTALHLAVLLGNAAVATELLAHGAAHDLTDNRGRTPAHWAAQKPPQSLCPAYYGSISAKQTVVDGRIAILAQLDTVDVVDDRGNTPLLALLEAREYDNIPPVLALLERGADPQTANLQGRTALMLAADFGQQDVVKALVSAGVPLNARDLDGNTALHLALYGHYSKPARYLIKKGADCHVANNKGDTPAGIAAAKGLVDVLELII